MLKFQQVTSEDRKLAVSIERKRLLEEARKSRIFNPRVRKIGVRITIQNVQTRLFQYLNALFIYICIKIFSKLFKNLYYYFHLIHIFVVFYY